MRPLDIFGIKNFRIFNSDQGFFKEFSAINLLTGANNTGKSSVLKALQMIKNSVGDRKIPFDLDLNNQEHLLGDFSNLLRDSNNKEVQISLPFTYFGVKSIYIELVFTIPDSKVPYAAHLAGMRVIDSSDSGLLFSFNYRLATDAEKATHKTDFENELARYEEEKKVNENEKGDIFSPRNYVFRPDENPLVGFVEWRIQFDRLKSYLNPIKGFYSDYLGKRETWKPLEEIDEIVKDSGLIPSLLVKSFKADVPISSWTDFIENVLADKALVEGKEVVGERDFEPDDYFFPVPKVQDVLYSKAINILKRKLRWTAEDASETSYSIIENSFETSWEVLVNRITTITYVSASKEENLRVYNSNSNSQFVKLLKEYANASQHKDFVRKYLRAFEIGKSLNVEYQPKYQSMSVQVKTFDDQMRDLADFGYGIKQIITFLIQINVLAERTNRTEFAYGVDGEEIKDIYDPSVLLIEEPESNLHPKWQTLLAEMFMEASEKFNVQLIIETHSEYLIRRFQTLVAEGKLSNKEVQLFYLRNSGSLEAGKQQIESVLIQEDGSIDFQSFDTGFFDESETLEFSLLNIHRHKFLEGFENLKQTQVDNEEKIHALEEKIDEFTAKANVSLYTDRINSTFDTSKLDPFTVKYLVSGQFILDNIDNSVDFSPVILQYGRAVENELKERLFKPIDGNDKWMLGPMQGPLEQLKDGATTMPKFSPTELARLSSDLATLFVNPMDLKIELLDVIRKDRNHAGHSGQIKNKAEAEAYIAIVNNFLNKWISELR